MSGARALKLGFIALNDAALLIVAKERGLFEAENLNVELVREVSWATVRDKLNVGVLDGAQMLGPLALATSVGAGGGEPVPLVAALALNLNGPTVTLSSRLSAALSPGSQATGLARLVGRRREEGASPITLAVVFPYSTHNYILRDWLARAGIAPDRDVRFVVAAPSRMTELLNEGVVEGFSVTEPWGSAAVASGAGKIVMRGAAIWPRTPDKVLALREIWASEHPEDLQAVLRAILRAAVWAEDPLNRGELASLLSRPQFLDLEAGVIEGSLGDMIFHVDEANAPEPIHAAWLLTQMARWAHIGREVDVHSVARRVYRRDLYATARDAIGLPGRGMLESLEGYGEGVFRLSEGLPLK